MRPSLSLLLRLLRLLCWVITLLSLGGVFWLVLKDDFITPWSSSRSLYSLYDDELIAIESKRSGLYGNIQQMSYADALQQQSKDKEIILSLLDSGYTHMALNLHKSFISHAMFNVLFICMDSVSVDSFREQGIYCYPDVVDPDASSHSLYNSKAFIRKTGHKIDLVLDALKLGFTVLLVDLDIVFFKNPLPFMDCDKCDIHYQYDVSEINSGFMYVRPTKASITLYEKAVVERNKRGIPDQKAIKAALLPMEKKQTIKSKRLSNREFPNGLIYYERTARQFAVDKPCVDCVLVHQNWVVGKAAKQYRLKESLQWNVDLDKNDVEGYYSSPKAMYLTYGNPGTHVNVGDQLQALRNALVLAHLLNRTLILPAFTCDGCKSEACAVPSRKCSLMAHVEMTAFDSNFYYREHMFLKHSAVPDTIKTSTSQPYVFRSSLKLQPSTNVDLNVLDDKGHTGLDSFELLSDLTVNHNHVLIFYSLYGQITQLYDDIDEKFYRKVLSGVKACDYRQFCTQK